MAAKDEMMVHPQTLALSGKALEEFVVRGNLAALSPADKAAHYIQLCNSLGLNPATKPFEYITLQGKETLYARRDATEQLRKIHNVSLEITGRETVGDVYVVTARATMPDGRRDESTGVVSVAGLKGEVLANKLMSCETKAKRRVTLSIVGLGILDESEFDTIPTDRFANLRAEAPKANVVTIEPKREMAKKGEALPEVPEVVELIPASILLAIKPLHGLEGVSISDMDDEDLELVAEHCVRARQVWQVTATSKRALDWLDAIACAANGELDNRHGMPPPNDDVPPPEEA